MNMAASVPQYPSCFTSRQSIKPAPSISRSCKFKAKASSSSSESDRVELAFAKARAYKKALQSSENRMKNDDMISDGDFPEVEVIVGTASKFGKAAASKPNTKLKEDSGRYKPKITSWGNRPSPSNISETDGPRATDPSPEGDFPEVEIIVGDASKFGKAAASKPTTTLQENSGLHKPKVPEPVDNDPLKLAFAKARAYKKADQSNKLTPKISPNSGRESSENQMKDDGLVLESTIGDTPVFADLMKQMAKQYRDNNTDDEISDGDFPEVELIVGDASKFGKAAASKPITTFKEDSGRYSPKITSWGTPPSPSNTSETDGPRATDSFPEGDFTEVEIIVGDASKFVKATASKPTTTLKEDSGLHKPKVSLEPEPVDNDPLKLAFAKASAYKKAVQSNISTPKISPNSGRESSENRMKNDGLILRSTNEDTPLFADLMKQMAEQNRDNNAGDTISGGDFPEVELIVGDPSKFGKTAASNPNTMLNKDSGQYKPKITSWGNRLSATNTSETDGSRAMEPFPEGDVPEVEIIVGDASKFGKTAASKPKTTLKEDSELHKAKVSSEPEPVDNDPLKLAFARASAYKKAVQSNIPTPKISPNSGRESSENRMKNDGLVLESTNEDAPLFADLMKQMAKQKRDDNAGETISDSFPDGDFPEVELIVGDPSKFGKAAASKPNTTLKKDSGRYEPKITSWGNCPGPSNTSETDGRSATEPFPEGDFPEVEIIVGDASKFGKTAAFKPATNLKEDSGLHKSKVSSEREPVDNDPLKLAFVKASAYKKAVESNNPTPKIFPNSGRESSENRMKNDGLVLGSTNENTPLFADLMKQMAKQNRDNSTGDTISDGELPEVELIVGDASKFGKAAASKSNTTLKEHSGRYIPKITSWGNPPSSSNTSEMDGPRATDSFPEGDFTEVEIIVGDASKFVKAAASKPITTLKEDSGSHKPKVSLEPKPVDNDSLKLAFAKASVYKKAVRSNFSTPNPNSGRESSEKMKNDGSILRSTSEDTPPFADLMKQMAGQNRDNNTGDMISDGDFPEVELIVGDPSKFGKAAASKPNTMLKDDSGRYKPKTTSWGNPPSPSNVSES